MTAITDHTILIVDDNPTNLGVLSNYLRDYGFRILVARNGESALKRLQYAQSDIILLDVMMPGMNGFETCQQLKANELTKEIPVIFMTALSEAEDKVKGFKVGAVDYVTKPLQHEEVLVRVTTHLQIRDLTRSLQEQNLQLQNSLDERKQAEIALQKVNDELSKTLENLKATQQQLIESEKMASLGGLVAGVAHEINTPIGIGVTAASTLESKTKLVAAAYDEGKLKGSMLKEYLDRAMRSSQLILSNLERASELVQSFKKVAVDQTNLEKRRFAVKGYIEDVLLSLRPKLKKSKHQVEVKGDDSITLDSHPGAFSQIVTNLVMNSLVHAYQEDSQGHLRFDMVRHQERLIIEYSDDGCGIPPENLSKIFEPFFTTARSRGGSGLGMHIVYNLVTQKLKGTIRCESEVGIGTKFIINLPIQVNEEE